MRWKIHRVCYYIRFKKSNKNKRSKMGPPPPPGPQSARTAFRLEPKRSSPPDPNGRKGPRGSESVGSEWRMDAWGLDSGPTAGKTHTKSRVGLEESSCFDVRSQ